MCEIEREGGEQDVEIKEDKNCNFDKLDDSCFTSDGILFLIRLRMRN